MVFSSNGIFGQGFTKVFIQHSGPDFFFDWLNKIKKFHDLHHLESDLHRYEEYFELKIKANMKPTPLPANVDEEFVYRLARDFIKEEAGVSMSIFADAQKAIEGNSGGNSSLTPSLSYNMTLICL